MTDMHEDLDADDIKAIRSHDLRDPRVRAALAGYLETESRVNHAGGSSQERLRNVLRDYVQAVDANLVMAVAFLKARLAPGALEETIQSKRLKP